ncbi:hypothetical protein L208DRAFT_120285 [Tricholoma matsutake]|nr:hypothetical protein L208DRAFT_120285 [Tricholoma matsutake 945]
MMSLGPFFWFALSIPPLPASRCCCCCCPLLLFPSCCCCCCPILILVVPPSLSSLSCPRCIGVPLSLSLSSPVVHLCHPSVFIPPCCPIVVIINVPKRFVSKKRIE